MRLTKNKINEVIIRILGEDGLGLVELLKSEDNISEFDLAKKLSKDIKVIRKMLYLLYNHNLVSFTRKKDKQKGWYIYYWTLVNENLKFAYLKKKKELLVNLGGILAKEEQEIFFYCPEKCVRLDFDVSMDFEFHCPECGRLLEQDNNTERVKDLRNRIEYIKSEIKSMKVVKKVKRTVRKTKAKKKEVKKKTRTATKKKVVKKPVKKKVTKKKIVKRKTSEEKTTKKKVTKKKTRAVIKKKVVKKPVKKKVTKKKIVKRKASDKKIAKKK